MLVFIDESGDSGFKFDKGSSEFFNVSLVIFNDNDEANACDNRIQLLKKELGKSNNWEFHFKESAFDSNVKHLKPRYCLILNYISYVEPRMICFGILKRQLKITTKQLK